jgi:hypothetical protein
MKYAPATIPIVPLSPPSKSLGISPFAPINRDTEALMLVAVVKRTRTGKERR